MQQADACSNNSFSMDDGAGVLAVRLDQLHLTSAAAQVVTRSRCHTDGEAAAAFSCSKDTTHTPTAGQQQYRLFTFDLEPTGLSQEYDAIIEMAAADVASGSSWTSLVRPALYRKSALRSLDAHGITEAVLLQPGVPHLPAAWAALLWFVADHTPPGAQPVLAAHNGSTFDFRMLSACLLRAQQQQQQQRGSIAADGGCGAGSGSSACASRSNGDCCSSSAQSVGSCCELAAGVLVLNSLVVARRLQLKQQAGLANLQQGTAAVASRQAGVLDCVRFMLNAAQSHRAPPLWSIS
ncbi:hypothetical protein COO60DRAFT_899570 [Scenedesmus sp. NREL 46B-D3]|nr:hypothetical protein COO60DRAFT_899570 [Scenedesmus sp. NREL 46B-D3]